MTQENIRYLLVRVWFNDGFYYEREFKDYGGMQWSLGYCDSLIRQHGLITDIIIDTE